MAEPSALQLTGKAELDGRGSREGGGSRWTRRGASGSEAGAGMKAQVSACCLEAATEGCSPAESLRDALRRLVLRRVRRVGPGALDRLLHVRVRRLKPHNQCGVIEKRMRVPREDSRRPRPASPARPARACPPRAHRPSRRWPVCMEVRPCLASAGRVRAPCSPPWRPSSRCPRSSADPG